MSSGTSLLTKKKDFVMIRKFCINCLKENHLARRRREARVCLFSGCGKRHYSLFHPPPTNNEEVSTPVVPETRETCVGDSQKNASRAGAEGQCAAIESGRPRLSLGIFPLKVRGCDGVREIEIYAFLDNDSDTTLYLDSFLKALVYPKNLFSSL